MSNTFIPFNFAPKAVQILQTGATLTYTIPANEFGYITLSSNLTPDQSTLSFNSVVVYKSGYVSTFSQTSGVNTAQSYTSPADSYGTMGVVTSGGGNVGTFSYGGSQTVTIPAIAGLTTTMYASTFREMNQSTHTQYWVKAGDVITINSVGSIHVVIHRYDLAS